jgi:hypothetical protein
VSSIRNPTATAPVTVDDSDDVVGRVVPCPERDLPARITATGGV